MAGDGNVGTPNCRRQVKSDRGLATASRRGERIDKAALQYSINQIVGRDEAIDECRARLNEWFELNDLGNRLSAGFVAEGIFLLLAFPISLLLAG